MKTIDELKTETEKLLRDEHERRLDREAKDRRDGPILDAFDRLQRGDAVASDATPPVRHKPRLKVLP